MYINFKSKYKKIFWILLGFVLSCIYVHKIYALTTFSGTEETYNFNDFSFTYNNHTYTKESIYNDISNNLSQYNKSISDFDYIFISVPTSPRTNTSDIRNKIQILLLQNEITGFSAYTGSDPLYFYFDDDPNSRTYIASYTYNLSTGQFSGGYTTSSWEFMTTYGLYMGNSSSNTSKVYTNYTFNWSQNSNRENINVYLKMYYDNNMLSTGPDYLQGYKEIVLQPGQRYYMFSSSSISSGSVYIPISDFNDYGSRISYFDKDIDTQPYTSYIQDFSTTPDGLYAKQNFDLSTYTGSDFIMYSKYIYLEGEDNFSSSVWVPEAMYSSLVEITPNSQGGNDFDFSYVDENGELQADIISSSDLSQGSPLVSDLFTNFTTKDYGLSSIITAPIPLLQTLNNASCSTIELPLGMFGGQHDNRLILPCMAPIYSSMFGQFFTLYQSITTGFIAYYVGLAYFNKIKQLKDPDNDDIEVVDL